MRSYYHFEKAPPFPAHAHFALPAGPGYAIEFDPTKIEKQELVHWA
jgi:hypothetical protein